ncbi:MAG: ATP-dependent DNA helicase RecG [Microgenomates group bacterium]
MNLSTPIEEIYLIGKTYGKRLKKLEISTVEDLLYHFPFRYIDYSLVSPINLIQPGEIVTVGGIIKEIKNEYTSTGKKIQKAVLKDRSGEIQIIWFNQPYLIKILKPGTPISVSGKADYWGKKIALISPEYEIRKKTETIHTGRLVPVYHETSGITSKWLRARIAFILKNLNHQLQEFLPPLIIKKYNLMDFKNALFQIHFPQDKKMAQLAKYRFAFEELFLLQLSVCYRKKEWQRQKLAKKLTIDQEKINEFINNLPFSLTNAQKRVIQEILTDMEKEKPMNRLLQGDVGSGKTVVAAVAIFANFLNGYRSVLMAPTEILANQHFKNLKSLFSPYKIKLALLTKESKSEEEADLIIGTHALIYRKKDFENLGLVIIDEQHRFGVEQRSKLINKGGTPHVLTMTATPIPRTVALTLYGDLDLSVLDEMPPGRKPVKTWVIPPQKRESAYRWISQQIKQNASQVFIICPLIEESEVETLQTVKAATTEYERLKKEVFPDLKLGLLHGKMKSKEKEEVLNKFKNHQLDILVATPVVEVGIDIPNATIMMIEGAERFGLAQLHQLRGRVGRGDKPSYCLLFTDYWNNQSLKRLKALEKTNIGMELAEIDLKMRGPGEIYGTRQHGFWDLKVADFSDLRLIELTKKASEEIFPFLKNYPLLQEKLKKYIIKDVKPN